MAQHDEDPRDEDKDEAGTTPEEEGGEAAETEAEAKPAAEEAPKEAPKAAPKKEAAKKAPKKEGARKNGDLPVVARRPAPPPQAAGSLGKSAVLFVVVVGALAAGFAVLGREPGGGGGARSGPAWKNGQVVDMEVTLVASDKRDLSCAATDEVAGRHCAWETPNKAWSKGDATDDKKVLRPYTTVDGVQFVGAGLWSEPALANNLPPTRFTVKCKFTVEGKLKSPTFHWENWEASPRGEIFSGAFSACSIAPQP